MTSTRPLLGKAFGRRFREFQSILAGVPEAEQNGPWRQIGDRPGPAELDRIWAEDKQAVGL